MSFERSTVLGAAQPLHTSVCGPLERRSSAWYFRREVEISFALYGVTSATVGHALGGAALHLALRGALRLDRRRYRRRLAKARVDRPLFIIGSPRSGTTFLHDLMIGADDMAAFKGWHLFWPALTGRPLARRVMAMKRRFGTTEIVPEWTGHRIDLDAYDEEEFLFSATYDTPLKAAGLLGLGPDDLPELDHPELLPQADRLRALEFLDGCLRRQILATGRKQIVAQMHMSTLRLQSLLAYYPDARFIYILRDPLQTVPSFLSLVLNIFDARWGLDRVPRALVDQLIARRYNTILGLYWHFHSLWSQGALPTNRVMVLPFDHLTRDVRGAMRDVETFSGITFSAAQQAHIDTTTDRQKGYRRRHAVRSLPELGLSRRQIMDDFAFVYDGFDLHPAPG